MKANKREWCYIQKPVEYEVYCDVCEGSNTNWSEYEKHIWCYDCEIDTRGTTGVFGSPVGLGACKMMGISFDRLYIETGVIDRLNIESGLYESEERDCSRLT